MRIISANVMGDERVKGRMSIDTYDTLSNFSLARRKVAFFSAVEGVTLWQNITLIDPKQCVTSRSGSVVKQLCHCSIASPPNCFSGLSFCNYLKPRKWHAATRSSMGPCSSGSQAAYQSPHSVNHPGWTAPKPLLAMLLCQAAQS